MDKICLSSFIYDQIENPNETLKDFFMHNDLQAHLKQLKKWRNVVQTNAYFEIDTFSSPIYEHKMMCNLINAAYALKLRADKQTNDLSNLSVKDQEKYLNHECLSLATYTKHLSTAELIDPFLVINSFFESFSIAFYHQQLYDWLTIGMSPNVISEDKPLVTLIYKNLRKLIEACWLIYKRHDSTFELSNPVPEAIAQDKDIEENDVPEQKLSSFKQFLSVVPPDRLNRGLRKMLVDYLFYNMEGLPVDFEDLLNDFYWLTEFLDDIQGREIDPKFL